MKRASQDHNIKLRELAYRIIQTGEAPDILCSTTAAVLSDGGRRRLLVSLGGSMEGLARDLGETMRPP